MLRSFAVLALMASAPAMAIAQTGAVPAATAQQQTTNESQQAESGQPPKRIRSITLTGNQQCPKSNDPDSEIVVCARQGEPYRIPKALRDEHPIPAQNQSWVNRSAVADDVGRRAAGLPDTCSPTGSGGQTGCAKLRAEQWAAEKLAAKRETADPQ